MGNRRPQWEEARRDCCGIESFESGQSPAGYEGWKDFVQPGIGLCITAIEVVELKSDELGVLASKTQALITTVGPYWKYGTPVVEACANSATHYLDVYGYIYLTGTLS